jgi:uncharacterized coiled-coil protein SlyX
MFFKKKSTVQKLRERPEWFVRELPDVIRIPALEGHRPEDVMVPLQEATLDELAFAIVGIEAQVAQARRGLSGLRELYEQARKRGGVGTNTVAEIYFSDRFAEVAK